MKFRNALTKKQLFSDGSILVATGLGISTDLKPFGERSGPHGSRWPCSTASVSESAPSAYQHGHVVFPHRAAVGVFLGQAREPLLRLLRAWTGENPLQQRPANHLNHSLQAATDYRRGYP